jgi:hypothetical protein
MLWPQPVVAALFFRPMSSSTFSIDVLKVRSVSNLKCLANEYLYVGAACSASSPHHQMIEWRCNLSYVWPASDHPSCILFVFEKKRSSLDH